MNPRTITVEKDNVTLVLVGEITRAGEKPAKKILYTTLKRLEEIMTVPSKKVIDELKAANPLIGTPASALKSYRLREGLTQAELAKKAGLKQHHISEMENGKRKIGLKAAKKLVNVLNCKLERLIS